MRRPRMPDGAQCPLCLGHIHPGKTTYMIDLNPGIMIVKEVPAGICNQCGEEWFEMDVSQSLDELADEMRAKGSQLEILPYPAGRIAEVA